MHGVKSTSALEERRGSHPGLVVVTWRAGVGAQRRSLPPLGGVVFALDEEDAAVFAPLLLNHRQGADVLGQLVHLSHHGRRVGAPEKLHVGERLRQAQNPILAEPTLVGDDELAPQFPVLTALPGLAVFVDGTLHFFADDDVQYTIPDKPGGVVNRSHDVNHFASTDSFST